MLIAGLFAMLLVADVPEMVIPEGTILPVILNETLNTARVQENDPVLLSLAEDVRAGGHRGRDAFRLLVPPTTVIQLLLTPKRGPDVVLPVETRLYVKLMSPIYVETRPRLGAAVLPQSIPGPQPIPQALNSPQPIPQALP